MNAQRVEFAQYRKLAERPSLPSDRRAVVIDERELKARRAERQRDRDGWAVLRNLGKVLSS